ncbi:MAG: hypothetical protein M1837_001884 [Sclerophora amabilis]|nr:MAG: hypothetical protein M1837_001884 [Sclerophora amabilis]
MIESILLCFVHGFKGGEDSFYDFPQDLKESVGRSSPHLRPEVAIYPKYETKGDLPGCVAGFREWLVGQVMIREKAAGNERPQQDPSVGVILVAHSMGGLVVTDALLSMLDDSSAPTNTEPKPIFPAIQGILTFDTPFVGLSRSMFAYGAFAQYRTISSAYGLVTSVSAIPSHFMSSVGTGSSSASDVASSAANAGSSSDAGTDKPAWKLWQMLAIRTGAGGAIAAAGAAAYMNRENIGKGLQYINKEDIGRGLSAVNLENIKQTLSMVNKDQIQQGFAYMSKENLGHGYAWLSSHLQFVGSLMKGQELQSRIERISSMEGVGFADLFTSLGPNDMWSGGYFVAERTFCAIPAPDTKANKYFIKEVNTKSKDEVEAHLSMFSTSKNPAYDEMKARATGLIMNWAKNNRRGVVDHYRLNNKGKPKVSNYTYGAESGFREVKDADKSAAAAKSKEAESKKKEKQTPDTKASESEGASLHTRYVYGPSGLQETPAKGKRPIVSEETTTTSAGDNDSAPPPEVSGAVEDPIAQAGPPEEENLDLENVPGVTEDLDIEKDNPESSSGEETAEAQNIAEETKETPTTGEGEQEEEQTGAEEKTEDGEDAELQKHVQEMEKEQKEAGEAPSPSVSG